MPGKTERIEVAGYLSSDGEVFPVRKSQPADTVPGGYIFLACSLGDQFLERNDLTAEDKIFLLRVAIRMEYGNTVEFTNSGIAEELGRHRVAVGRTVDKLVKKDILIKGSVRGSYLINPHLTWKGDSGNKSTAFRRIRELTSPKSLGTGDNDE